MCLPFGGVGLYSQSEIEAVRCSEICDPRKRQLPPRPSNWVEFYDPKKGRFRKCLRSERGFEDCEKAPVSHVKPESEVRGRLILMRPPGSPNSLARFHVFEAEWVPPGSDSDIRREVMGSWLGEIAKWTHFATWTFSRSVTADGAMHFGRKHLNWLARWDVDVERGPGSSKSEREGRKDERARQKAASERLQAFLAVERGENGGLLHLHALAGGIRRLAAYCGHRLQPGEWGRHCCMAHNWPCGYARVFPYDPALGAKHYVSKYVIKGHLSEWGLAGNLHCRGRACSCSLH